MCLKLLRHINDNSIRNNLSIRKNNYVTSVPYLCQNLFLSKLTLEKYSIYGGEGGFEPSLRLPVNTLSKWVPSTKNV